MNRSIFLIIFFTLFMIAVSSVHYYIWRKLVKNTNLKGKQRRIITILIVSLGISFPLSFSLAKVIPYNISFYFLVIGNLWLGMMLLFLFSFLFTDSLQLFVKLFNKMRGDSNVSNSQRREFISKSIALGVTSVVLGATAFSIKKYNDIAVVKKIKIKLDKLPDFFKGFKIVQLSDIHIGQIMRKHTLAAIVEQVNSLNADIVVITGDLIDGSVGNLFDEVTPLKDLKSKQGVYFVTGNHEYYSGVEEWITAISNLGIKVLQNENIEIKAKNSSESLYLVGVNDRDASRFGKKYAPDFKKAFSKIDKNKTKILLAHQPPEVEKAAKFGTDLMLSGHTHGGQIWPFGYLVAIQQKYLKGYFKYKNTHLYVNQGTGCWGPPMRLDTENEITELTLI